jgi:hypothetical protein
MVSHFIKAEVQKCTFVAFFLDQTMAEHPWDGQLNATSNHGSLAVCRGCNAGVTQVGVPEGCQAVLLATVWFPTFDALDTRPELASKQRFKLRCCWAKNMGIFGIRVEAPACVEALLATKFGQGTSPFIAGKNNCW